jgi:parvulin-like peptidyl-prolyl isomerase
VPSNAVAKVDDTVIEKKTFDRWLKIAAISSQGQQQPGAAQPKVEIPQPPEFTSCVAQKRKTTPKPAKGQPQPKESDFKAQCKQEYEGLRDQVMQLLIQNEWVANEAKQQNVKVSDADVKKAFDDQKKQSFPKEADYKNFLKTSGFTEEDIFFRVRLEQLSNKLREKVTKGKDKVSDKQIQTYYDKNKKRFAQPERRDLRIVLTRDRAKAEQAKSAVEGGRSWKAVAKEFSTDQASKNQGGHAAGRRQGPAGARAGQGRLRREEGRAAGSGQDPVRLVRLLRPEGHARQPAVAEGGLADDQGHPRLREPAEGARHVHQGLPEGVEGEDELPQGLRDPGLQERSEGQDRHERGSPWRRPDAAGASRRPAGAAAGAPGRPAGSAGAPRRAARAAVAVGLRTAPGH